MGKQVKRRTVVSGDNGETHVFNPGDEVPDDLAAKIDNPDVWETPEGVDPSRELGTVETDGGLVSTGPATVADAPYVQEDFPVHTADSGPVSVDGGTSADLTGKPAPTETGSTGEDSGTGSSERPAARVDTRPSRAQLDGMTKSELETVAASHGISVPQGATKAEVRSAIDSAEQPGS